MPKQLLVPQEGCRVKAACGLPEEQPPLRAADEPAAPGGAALAPAAVGGAPPASNRAARVGKFHARGSLCPLLQYFIPKTV